MALEERRVDGVSVDVMTDRQDVTHNPKLTPHQIKGALRRRDLGEPVRDIGKSFNVSHGTISRLAV
jgi:hypothetical protein